MSATWTWWTTTEVEQVRELAMPMHSPSHPGSSVRHDCLEPLGLSVTDGARVLGVSRKQLVGAGEWAGGDFAGDGDSVRQGFWRWGQHLVSATGGV